LVTTPEPLRDIEEPNYREGGIMENDGGSEFNYAIL
jgi:hypothetical protein